MYASRDVSAARMLVCERIVRDSWILGLAEAVDSHAARLGIDNEPSGDLGDPGTSLSDEKSDMNCFSSSYGVSTLSVGFDAAEPMVVNYLKLAARAQNVARSCYCQAL